MGMDFNDIMEAADGFIDREAGDASAFGGVWFGVVWLAGEHNPITGEVGPVRTELGEVPPGFYGLELNSYGQRNWYEFPSPAEMDRWFDEVTAGV